MTGLLDTHALIWFDSDPSRLSPAATEFIRDANNRILVSAASVWEMVVKSQLGKLTMRASLSVILDDQAANGVEQLSISVDHALKVHELPAYHRDPFDRMLIAQALCEDAVIVTADELIRQYPVTVIW